MISTATSNRETNLLKYQDTGVVQTQISKVPSDTFMWLAIGSIIGSLTLKFMGKKDNSLFVGQWAPTFAILGVFDKIIRAERV